jgi:hypothetical protein
MASSHNDTNKSLSLALPGDKRGSFTSTLDRLSDDGVACGEVLL